VVCPVLVAYDDEASDTVEGYRCPVGVGLREQSVHALERSLENARRLSQPGGSGENEYLSRGDLFVDGRPTVIGVDPLADDAGRDVVIDEPDVLDVDI
jgi:hypothetical protein